jgi:hypothetical protein
MLAGLALLVAPAAAEARWLQAETQRFVVYSDGEEDELRRYATDLANFDLALRLIHHVEGRDLERKFEVYLVRNDTQLRRVLPGARESLAHTRRPRAGSSRSPSAATMASPPTRCCATSTPITSCWNTSRPRTPAG